MPFCVSLLCLALLPGCITVPELDATVPPWTKDAAYPRLVPLGPEFAPVGDLSETATAEEQALEARRQRLQNRARRLTGPVVDEPTRQRMSDGVRF